MCRILIDRIIVRDEKIVHVLLEDEFIAVILCAGRAGENITGLLTDLRNPQQKRINLKMTFYPRKRPRKFWKKS